MKQPANLAIRLPSSSVAPARALAHVLIALMAMAASHPAVSAVACGPLGEPFGDYLVDKERVARAESFHFTPEVEALIRGKSTTVIGADINFMLVNFPNHHRALVAMQRLAEREKKSQPAGAHAPVECYFDRAVRFRPDDVVARMLYASYLAKAGRGQEAAAQLEAAAQHAEGNPFSAYNIGLIYFEMKAYEKALAYAHIAYAAGFPQPALREMLQAAGAWKNVPAPALSGSAPA